MLLFFLRSAEELSQCLFENHIGIDYVREGYVWLDYYYYYTLAIEYTVR